MGAGVDGTDEPPLDWDHMYEVELTEPQGVVAKAGTIRWSMAAMRGTQVDLLLVDKLGVVGWLGSGFGWLDGWWLGVWDGWMNGGWMVRMGGWVDGWIVVGWLGWVGGWLERWKDG